MHQWSLPSWTTATRSLQVLLDTCKTGCSLCWMPLFHSSILVGCQSTLPTAPEPSLVTCTGANPVSVVFWHITVCMAQHRRILQTACGRHQSSSPVAIYALPTRLRCWCRRSTRRVTLGDCTFPVAETRRGTVCQHRWGPPRPCCLFGGRQRPVCFSCRTTDFWLLSTIVFFKSDM